MRERSAYAAPIVLSLCGMILPYLAEAQRKGRCIQTRSTALLASCSARRTDSTSACSERIGFSGPIFICLGASLFLGGRMSVARWTAVIIGFAGVLIVVQPWAPGGFSGISPGMLLMLAAGEGGVQ